MAHNEDSFTPEEQAQAEAIDQQIDERLHALPFLPPDQRGASDPLLIQELSRFYQPQAEEIRPRLQRARERVEQRIAHPLTQRQRKRKPLTRLRSLRERQDHMKTPRSFFHIPQRSSRLVGLAAVLLLAVLVGGLVTGLILVRSHGSTTAHPTQPTATLAPGPTQTPGSTLGVQGLVSIQMLDATNGWAISGQNHILRTTDGAIHWQDVTPPSIDPPQANYSNLTYDFLSPSLAWVYSFVRDANDPGGTTKYYRTTNGGQLWLSMVKQGEVPSQIIFTDSDHGWMFSGTGVAAGSSGADIFRTTDGGATWTKVASASPSTANQPGALPFSGDKTGIGARDAMTAWAAGTESAPSLVWLYVTHDGGATWQHQTLPIPSSPGGQMVTMPPTFFNAQDGILPVAFDAGNAEPYDIYVTRDGGATWQSTSLLSITPAYIGGLDFINASQGWATDGSTLYVTSDSGQGWTKLSPNVVFQHASSLNFVSNEIGWAIDNPLATPGPTTLLKTTDGGQTWAAVPLLTS